MGRSRLFVACVAALCAGLATAAGPGQEGGPAAAWTFQSLRAKLAKKAYDAAARKASDRYKAELARLKKPLVHALTTAMKAAERQGNEQEAAKLKAALGAANDGALIPPTTNIVGWAAEFEGHSYLAILAPARWNDARAVCRKLGGHLAWIDTREEMTFLQKMTSGVGVYVGATDAHREGDWRWTSKRPVDRKLWKIKEPDGRGGQNHAALSTAGLYDVSDGDDGVRGFICEWEP